MKYVKAQTVLPKELIKSIQEYIDGEYLYIPRKNGHQKAWGEKNGSKIYFKKRNTEIYMKYISGIPVIRLSEEYFLSEQSIRRIVSDENMLSSKSIQNHS